MEHVAGQAFSRMSALAGMLARLKELARSCDTEAAEVTPPDAITASCDAEPLLRHFDSRPWDSIHVAANGARRARPRARLDSGMAAGG
jgi:hypothetical protein